jgi:uncharacterized repeat protein (TIGR03806 family)
MKYLLLILLVLHFSACAGSPVPDPDVGLFARPSNTACLAGPPQAPASNLAQTGCVDPEDPTQGASGLIPYDLNFPFWSDGAVKQRWMGLPDGQTVDVDEAGDWQFPIGTVLLKMFSVEGQVIETRLFMRHEDGNWAGYSYEWNEAVTQATLVPSGGKIRILNNGQTWQYPGRSQCLFCHNNAAGHSLGIENAQLNRLFTYPSTGITANQIKTLASIEVLSQDPGDPAQLPSFFPWFEQNFPDADQLNAAARAYLHTNCSICHRPGGPGGGHEDFRFSTTLASMNACDLPPTLADYGIVDPLLIAPGDPDRSIVSFRIGTELDGRMPPLASFVVDEAGLSLINDWIASLSSCD